MLTTSLGSAFAAVLAALDASDSAALQGILCDPRYELPAALAEYQKALGEVLINSQGDDAADVKKIGWLLIALAEISLSWERSKDFSR